MFDNVFEQVQSATKPVSELISYGSETAEQLFKKQSKFANEIVADSVEFTKGVVTQKDINSIIELQKSFVESLQEKATANGKEVYDELSSVQEKTNELLKDLFSKAGEVATEAAKTVSEKVTEATEKVAS